MFIIVFARVGWLQAVSSADLGRKAVASRTTDRRIEPKRGNILDATGKVLATSIATKTVFIEPQTFQDAEKTLKKKDPDQYQKLQDNMKQLADLLQIKLPDLQSRFNSPRLWVSLGRQLNLDKADVIKRLNIPGVGFSDDGKRVYPMGGLVAPILGVVNLDGFGVEGLELSYDKILYGEKGYISEETDARSGSLLGGIHSYLPPQDGSNLALTIDSNIQYLVDQQLNQIVSEAAPASAIIIVMDPKTGKILAMGDRPSFDPNEYSKFPEPSRRNLGISTQYEPGSTFKIITGSAALEEGTTSPNKTYRDPGYLVVDKQRITNWDSGNSAPGLITFTQGMEQSSNVVLGQVGLELPRDIFFKYIRGFGFGQQTGVDLPGEATGTLLREQKTSRFEQATMSFGQANAVTPLQMVSAISAIANGGTLYKPYVVDQVMDSEGNVTKQYAPTPVRQVISQNTSDQLKLILEKVVTSGTGQLAKVEGYRVAGKTGTAQKVDATGKYSSKDFIASFIGFAPVDVPKFAIIVIVDSPSKGGYHGGEVAAPKFQAIVQQVLAYMNVPPSEVQKGAPLELTPGSAKPQPKPFLPERKPNPGEGVVPDLSGRSMSEVGELLSKQGLRMNFVGSGLAVSQDYPPGKVVMAGTVITVKFEP